MKGVNSQKGWAKKCILPRKTPIALAATTFPIELSAVGSLIAEIFVANRSIWDVPNVIIVIAVTSSFSPTKSPQLNALFLYGGATMGYVENSITHSDCRFAIGDVESIKLSHS